MTRQQIFYAGLIGLVVLAGWGIAIPLTVALDRVALPPDSSVASPLHTGANTQQKTGSLIIGTANGTSKFCLNPDIVKYPGTTDPENCISNWSANATSQYVTINAASLSSNFSGPASELATLPGNYVGQSGYSDITGNAASSITAKIGASAIGLCVRDYSEQGEGFCYQDQNATCFINSDCIAGANGAYKSTAVYGVSDGGSSSYAGYFAGGVYVRAANTDPATGPSWGRICLGSFESFWNPTFGAADGCINSWSEITFGSALYVQLQSANPPTQQISSAAISGSSQFGAAVIGSTAGIGIQYTCGNLICETATENATSCPVDCATISSPTGFSPTFSSAATLANLQITLPITTVTTPGQPASTVKVLIVRSLTTAPSFRPVDGSDYPLGTDLGNNTVVVANTTTTSGQTLSLTNTLPARGTYYFQAYQANSYPKYSTPTAAVSLTPMELAVTVSPSNKATVTSSPANITCTNNVTNCKKLFTSGTSVTLSVNSIASDYIFNTWLGSCDQTNGEQCMVTMNTDKSITATFVPSGDGGGDGPPVFE